MATLDKVSVDLMVVLGTTTMPIHQVMRLSRGAIIELDATEADEVKILANNLPWLPASCWSIATGSLSKSSKCCRNYRLFGSYSVGKRPCPSISDLLHRRR